MTRAVFKGLLIRNISHRRFMNKTIILKRKTDIKMDRYHARAVTMTAMLAAVSPGLDECPASRSFAVIFPVFIMFSTFHF